MSVDRRPAERWLSNADQAQRSARELIAFICEHLQHLRKVDRARRMETAIGRFRGMLDAGEKLTPNQLSYVEAIYEKTMEGAGLPAARTHRDQRPRGLRYG